jgi:hypothetical protein
MKERYVKYTVEPEIVEGCECEDCRAGRHLYALHRWLGGQWTFVGVSLQSYASADDCKRTHWWGIEFRPDDVWEDGTPITPPEHMEKPASGSGRKVVLNTAALQQAAERLKGHWLR